MALEAESERLEHLNSQAFSFQSQMIPMKSKLFDKKVTIVVSDSDIRTTATATFTCYLCCSQQMPTLPLTTRD